jgi:hypothetical protein
MFLSLKNNFYAIMALKSIVHALHMYVDLRIRPTTPILKINPDNEFKAAPRCLPKGDERITAY